MSSVCRNDASPLQFESGWGLQESEQLGLHAFWCSVPSDMVTDVHMGMHKSVQDHTKCKMRVSRLVMPAEISVSGE